LNVGLALLVSKMRCPIFLFIFLLMSNTGIHAATIAVAGDSMACTYTNYPARGWGQKLPVVLNATINNSFAASGSSTLSFFNGSYAVDGIHAGLPNSVHRWANLLASQPNYIFISFGWNDAGTSSDPERYCTIPDYKTNLGKMIDDARSIGAIPLLLTTPPGRFFSTNGTLSNSIRPYADAMIQEATAKAVAVIDLNADLFNLYQAFGSTSAPLFGFSPTDGLHLGEYGATCVTHLIANEIPTVLPSLASSLLPGSNQLAFSNGGSTLILNPVGESTIKTPILLQDDVIIDGTGIVHFDGGIQGGHSLTVQAGMVTTTSITVNTLTIGTTMAVPEPSTLALLGMSAFSLLACARRRGRKGRLGLSDETEVETEKLKRGHS
jgi:lysophospholipase L1-like esterase